MSDYNILLSDPPWAHRTWAKDTGSRTAQSFYKTMTLPELKALDPFIAKVSAPTAVHFMWTTGAMLPESLELLAAWGFAFKTVALVWVKLSKAPAEPKDIDQALKAGGPLISVANDGTRKVHFGMGHYTRSQVEFCLLGTRGVMPRGDKGVPQAIFEPVGAHSAKPAAQYERIRRLYPKGRYLELFARTRAPGWAAWGDELETN